jgi:hydrogenase maturation protease
LRNAVVGIGNLNRRDDGVGIHAVNRLRGMDIDIDAFDMSTANLELLDYVRGREKVAIIDAMVTGDEPGTVSRVKLSELRTTGMSGSHGLYLTSTLTLGYQLYPDDMPKEVHLFTVEAGDVETFSEELTPRVEASIPRLLILVSETLS